MTESSFVSTSASLYFDSQEAATMALLAILLDAKKTDKIYSFGPLSAEQILASGLRIEGDIAVILKMLEKIPGVLSQKD